MMLREYDPWIEFWRVLNSRTTKQSGIADWIVSNVELTGNDVEILIELDSAYAEVEREEREKERAKR